MPIALVTIRLQTEIQSDLHNENPIISTSVSILFAHIQNHYIYTKQGDLPFFRFSLVFSTFFPFIKTFIFYHIFPFWLLF